MTAILVGRFLENQDTTSIIYRKFGESFDGKYPTFSICFKGARFVWNRDLAIFDSFGLNSYEFERMLVGQTPIRHEYNQTSRLYRKIPTHFYDGVDVNVSNFHVAKSEIIRKFESFTDDTKQNFYGGKNGRRTAIQSSSFYIGFLTPNMICLTRNSNDRKGATRLYDDLVLERQLFNNTLYKDTILKIIVHYPGHLIQSINNQRFSSSFSKYQVDTLAEFKLSQGTLLRKRPDSNEPCNDKINDHDAYLQREISKEFDCVPPYWNTNLKKELKLSGCNTPNQLKKIHDYIEKDHNKGIIDLHDAPCLYMYNSVTYMMQPKEGDDTPMMRFSYTETDYQEIQYVRDFSIESFWSGIGGFVGIFLGYSMMQLPEILGRCTWYIESF